MRFKTIPVFIFLLLLTKAVFALIWEPFNLPSNKITTILPTSEGLIASEFDDRSWVNPYNGVYYSKNGGLSWQTIGLNKKGIEYVYLADNTLFASSFYASEGSPGILKSSYPYTTWEHIGPTTHVTAICKFGSTIYLGTESQGLWLSFDNGLTWEKANRAEFNSKILNIFCTETIVMISTVNRNMVSRDLGQTWEQTLVNYTIYSTAANDIYVFAGGIGQDCVFRTKPDLNSWECMRIENNSMGIRKVIARGQMIAAAVGQDVIRSTDNGSTWESLNANAYTSTTIRDLALVGIQKPRLVFVDINGVGFSTTLDSNKINKVFTFPWRDSESANVLDKINSFFDHSYPLLSYRTEPTDEQSTTLTFYGQKDAKPKIFYSSHGGIDFDMDYGEDVLAVESGTASYYQCKDCGNAIKLNHLNGVQTTYMHLQKDGLATTAQSVWINKGDTIGKIGMTGKTTGPHLHFEVLLDLNQDGIFANDLPDGRTDPFGWNYLLGVDPWPQYKWSDSLGEHRGSQSSYLWNTGPESIETKTNISAKISLGNKVVEILENHGHDFLDLILQSAPKPTPPKSLDYVKNSAFYLDLKDQLGNTALDYVLAKIQISISAENLINIVPETLKLYRWAEETETWIEVASTFDSSSKVLEAVLDHFSYFAIFGEKSDILPPETFSTTEPPGENSFYLAPITVTLSTNEMTDTIFYSLDDGYSWLIYAEPISIESPGYTQLLYKARDTAGNWEQIKQGRFWIGSKPFGDTASIKDVRFSVN